MKIRGENNPTGISFRDYEKIKKLAIGLKIPLESVLIAFGSFNRDIREIKFYVIP